MALGLYHVNQVDADTADVGESERIVLGHRHDPDDAIPAASDHSAKPSTIGIHEVLHDPCRDHLGGDALTRSGRGHLIDERQDLSHVLRDKRSHLDPVHALRVDPLA